MLSRRRRQTLARRRLKATVPRSDTLSTGRCGSSLNGPSKQVLRLACARECPDDRVLCAGAVRKPCSWLSRQHGRGTGANDADTVALGGRNVTVCATDVEIVEESLASHMRKIQAVRGDRLAPGEAPLIARPCRPFSGESVSCEVVGAYGTRAAERCLTYRYLGVTRVPRTAKIRNTYPTGSDCPPVVSTSSVTLSRKGAHPRFQPSSTGNRLTSAHCQRARVESTHETTTGRRTDADWAGDEHGGRRRAQRRRREHDRSGAGRAVAIWRTASLRAGVVGQPTVLTPSTEIP